MQILMSNYLVLIAIWCLILSTYIVLISRKEKSLEVREKRKVQSVIYFISLGLLVFDLLTFRFVGYEDDLSCWIMTISSYALYLLKYMYVTYFTIFLMKKNGKHVLLKKILLGVSILLGLTGMMFISIPEIRESIYYLDEYNYIYYGSNYNLLRANFILDILVMLAVVLLDKKQYGNRVFKLYVGYTINLIITGIMDYYMDAWYLQDMAIFFSTMIIFIDNMMKVSEDWSDTKKDLILSEFRASHDLMTGVWNKTYGLKNIKDYIENMSDDEMAVLGFVDIDDFKAVNDTFGHEVGDFWICEIAKTLEAICASEDIVCRYGGDEFVIFMKNMKDSDELASRIEQFQNIIHKDANERQQDVHCSMGLYQIIGSGYSLDECIKKADELVYEAKEKGKNTYIIG